MTEERATNLCSKCGNPIMPANLPYSYVGQVCLCFHKLGEVPEQPSPSLTEPDVRRIVRDELVRARVIADRSRDVKAAISGKTVVFACQERQLGDLVMPPSCIHGKPIRGDGQCEECAAMLGKDNS
jgi:hypothetical protein